jgi:hypothetical protein
MRRQAIIAVFCIVVVFLTACSGSAGNGNGTSPSTGNGDEGSPSTENGDEDGLSDGADSPSLPADELTLTRALSGTQHFVVVDDAIDGEAAGIVLAYPEAVEVGESPSFEAVGGDTEVFSVGPTGTITVTDADALGLYGDPDHELTVRISKSGYQPTDITVTIELLEASTATFFDFSSTVDGDGTRANPYNNYRNIANDGTTYLFKRGTTLDLGTSEVVHSDGYDNILVASYGSGALPRIIGTGGTNHRLVAIGRGTDGFTVRDLEITTDSPSSDGSAWADLAVYGYAYGGAWKNVRVEHCHVHHAGGIVLISNSPEPNAYTSTVAWNHIHDIPSDGVFLQSVDGESLVHANRIYRVNLNWHHVGHTEGEANGDGIQAGDTEQMFITRNYIKRTYTGNKFGVIVGADTGDWVEISDNYFVNAVNGEIETTGVYVYFPEGRVSRNLFVGANFGAYASVGGDGVIYDHNVFYNCRSGIHDNIGRIRNNLFYGVSTAITYGAGEFYNNIVYFTEEGQVIYNHWAAIDADNNLYNREQTDMFGTAVDSLAELTGGEGSTVIADPLFIAPAAGNFRVQEGSRAIGTGVAYTEDKTDFEGTTLGSPPNIGAFEYNNGAGD